MPSSFKRSRVDISSATGSYPVQVAPGLLDRTLAEAGERVWMVDSFLAEHFRVADVSALVIEADEHAKSLDRMTDVIVALREARVTRGTELIAVGGGVVQDVAAFAASIYMRGLAWTYLPTTLLAMTDSCVGGKSSINVGRYKNIVGTFHPPKAVLIDPTLTRSLSDEQRAAGLCEAVKICLCRGPATLDAYLSLQPTPAADEVVLGAVIDLSLRAKKWFIEVDEFDRAERLLLNFGHTFGHALEAATGFAISHGIAVGLGMLAALRLGEAMGRDYAAAPHVERFREHVNMLVAVATGVEDALAVLDPKALIDAFASDKKHSRDRYALITINTAGAVQREFLPRNAASERLIEDSYVAMIADRRIAAVAARAWTGAAAKSWIRR